MKLPEVLTPQQLRKFFSVIEDPQYMVIYLLGTMCGLRRESIVILKKSDVDIDNRVIRIRDDKNPLRSKEGHGNDRNVPIPEELVPLLELWVQYHPGNDFMFPSAYFNKDHISENALTKKITIDIRRAGIQNPTYVDKGGKMRHLYHFHTLRHSYGTYYYEKTGDIVGLQRNMGHRSIQTTQIYTHISIGERKRRVDEVFSSKKSLLLEPEKEAVDPLELEKVRHSNKMKELEMEREIAQLNAVKIEVRK